MGAGVVALAAFVFLVRSPTTAAGPSLTAAASTTAHAVAPSAQLPPPTEPTKDEPPVQASNAAESPAPSVATLKRRRDVLLRRIPLPFRAACCRHAAGRGTDAKAGAAPVAPPAPPVAPKSDISNLLV